MKAERMAELHDRLMEHQTPPEDQVAQGDLIDGKQYVAIVCDFSMSEHRLGGDDVVQIVDDVLKAQMDGYTVHTWYGPETEVLVLGLK